MKVYITQGNSETAVEIHCVTADERTGKLKKYIEAYGMTLSGKADGETKIVPLKDILYFESVDGRTFIYTRDSVLETDKKLYELEEWLEPGDFYRCSKSCIINI
ncbi:MAG: LytTR family transcriptional regulator, partial [Ruminiclostridium sp.]|nr:LytTR family transcriptional regulator [Ruminiclostridium sp.]